MNCYYELIIKPYIYLLSNSINKMIDTTSDENMKQFLSVYKTNRYMFEDTRDKILKKIKEIFDKKNIACDFKKIVDLFFPKDQGFIDYLTDLDKKNNEINGKSNLDKDKDINDNFENPNSLTLLNNNIEIDKDEHEKVYSKSSSVIDLTDADNKKYI